MSEKKAKTAKKELTHDERVALMDAQVAANREFGHRSGGNTTEPGQYEAPSAEALALAEAAKTAAEVPASRSEVAPPPEVPDDNDERVAAMDAQVAASTGASTTGMTTGAQTSNT